MKNHYSLQGFCLALSRLARQQQHKLLSLLLILNGYFERKRLGDEDITTSFTLNLVVWDDSNTCCLIFSVCLS